MSNEDGRTSSSSTTARSTTSASFASSSRRSGHQFHSRPDTEVDRPRLRRMGRGLRRRFNGMFAFAIWDRPIGERLFLARDRYGVKPLYWHGGSGVARVRVRDQGDSRAPVESPRDSAYPALNEYFTFQNIFSDLTLFDGIRLLPAGRTLHGRRRRRRAGRDCSATGTTRSSPDDVDDSRGRRRRAARALRAGGQPAAASATCRSARISAAASTRTRSPPSRVRHLPRLHDVHRRLRPQLRIGPRARLRRAAERPR